MPSEKPPRRLRDIIENISAVEAYLAGLNFAEFERDRRTRDAVERCLERISEAAAKLGDLAESLMPDQPWRMIRATGNRLRHEYDSISGERLWRIVESDLPSLKAACQDALTRLARSEER